MADESEIRVAIKADIQSLLGGMSQASESVQQATTSMADSAKKNTTQMTTDFNGLSSNVISSTESMKSSVLSQIAIMGALTMAFIRVKEVIREVVSIYVAMDSASRTMAYSTGNASGGMAFARKVAMDLGQELVATTKMFSLFAASAKGTSLEGYKTEQVFRSIASASTVMGLSTDETKGTLIALGQMISKGTVQAEELKRQLGNRLPGAFQIAARAMGMTTAELQKAMEKGEVMASTFLPKFAVELNRALGDAPRTASQSFQSNINRMKIAWTDLLLKIGEAGVIDKAADSLRSTAGIFKVLSNSIEPVAALMSNVGVQAAALMVALWALTKVSVVSAAIIALRNAFVTAQIAGVQFAVMNIGHTLMAMINPAVLATAAVLAVVVAIGYIGQSYSASLRDSARANTEAATAASNSARDFMVQKHEVIGLESALLKSKDGSKEHEKASRDLNLVVKELLKSYPDFISYLHKENGEYINVNDSMERYSKTKLKILKIQLEATKAAQEEAKQWAVKSDDTNILSWVMVGRKAAENAREEAAAHGKTVIEIEKQIALLEGKTEVVKPDEAPAKKKEKSLMPIWEKELEAQKVAYKKQYGELADLDQNFEHQFWAKKAKTTAAGMDDRNKAYLKAADITKAIDKEANDISEAMSKDLEKKEDAARREGVELAKKETKEELEERKGRLKEELDDLKGNLNQQMEAIQHKVNMGVMSEKKALDAKKKILNQIKDAEVEALQQANAMGDLSTKEKIDNERKILEFKRKTRAEIKKIDDKALEETANKFKSWFQSATSSISASLKGILDGTKKFSDLFKSILNDMTSATINMFVKMAISAIENYLVKTIFAKSTNGQEAMSAAAVYSNNAMASVAAIPITGWAAAPAVGAAALAAGEANAAIAYSAGGWDNVPSDQLAMIHKNEMVMSAPLAQGIRDLISGGGQGGGQGGGNAVVNVHFNGVVDAQGFIQKNQGNLVKTIQDAVRRGRGGVKR